MEKLTAKELAEAKREARTIRIRNIRRRIAYGAAATVALFSGLTLFRSVEQQPATTAKADSSSDASISEQVGAAIVSNVTSVIGGDHDSDHESAPSSDAAPLTTSQS